MQMHLKNIFAVILLAGLITFTSCYDDNDTRRTFIPDMQYSPPYEVYSESELEGTGGMSARLPVKGTIPRGHIPYNLKYAEDGNYPAKSDSIKSPFAMTEATVAKGGELYTIYCAVCHGKGGEGDGVIVENGKYVAVPPSYFSERVLELTEGDMFYTLTYGFGNMGSYASQLNAEERWKVVHYIKSLQYQNAGKDPITGEAAIDEEGTEGTEAASEKEEKEVKG